MIKEIVIWPDTVLARKSEVVPEVTDDVRRLLSDMADTMRAAKGAGLAAVQLGYPLRLVTLLVREKDGEEKVIKLVNPRITDRSPGTQLMREGCLSLPGFFDMVRRHTWVQVKALDETGAEVEIGGAGILAHALQHELEHLDGIMLPDHLSVLKRNMAKKRFVKAKAEGMRYRADRPEPQDFTERSAP